jgi:hypothetical protein
MFVRISVVALGADTTLAAIEAVPVDIKKVCA